jgi:peptide/nickel transport system substrate-binding protein
MSSNERTTKITRRTLLQTAAATAASAVMPKALLAQQKKTVFRWVPKADVTIVDPIFSTADITTEFGHVVFDSLYGLDGDYQPHPQMAEGHKVENDGLQWTITLRDGLRFHDDTPVRPQDVIASLKRWAKKDGLGKRLMATTEELSAPDDKSIRFKLKKPFPLLLDALARAKSNMCCIMPERLAQTPDNVQIKEVVGSSAFRFLPKEWVTGSRLVFEKFAGYVPRKDGTPSFNAGPKIAHIDRLEWHIIADAATSVAALQAGEIDGIEVVDPDFLPTLQSNRDIQIVRQKLANVAIMRFNHLHPPFNNPAIRRALLKAVDQAEYMTAISGSSVPGIWSDGCGYFSPGTTYASTAGLEVLTSKRDLEGARKAIKDAGYNGEPVVVLDATDFAPIHAMALVSVDLFKRLGFNVQLASLDLGTMLTRRLNKNLPSEGGWSVSFTRLTGTLALDPISNSALRGNGQNAWFGWPTSEKLERLIDSFYTAKDTAERQKICRDIQLQAFEDVPYIPLGAGYDSSAIRKNWAGLSPHLPVFYNLRKTS